MHYALLFPADKDTGAHRPARRRTMTRSNTGVRAAPVSNEFAGVEQDPGSPTSGENQGQ
ncbi:hypothetical protein ACOM2C_10465 [Pseudarthrobacter sp. So.54]